MFISVWEASIEIEITQQANRVWQAQFAASHVPLGQILISNSDWKLDQSIHDTQAESLFTIQFIKCEPKLRIWEPYWENIDFIDEENIFAD